MLTVIAPLLAGVILGRRFALPTIMRVFETLVLVSLVFLLLTMGALIGSDPQVMAFLPVIGWHALWLALAAVAVSTGAAWLVQRGYPGNWLSGGADQEVAAEERGLPMTWLIVGAVGVGLLLGRLVLDGAWRLQLTSLSSLFLGLLLLGIGVDLGSRCSLPGQLASLGWRALLLPAAVASGSIAGTALVGGIFGLPLREAAAVGAGFGWYSLSGVIISSLHGTQLGALAFLTNVLRELLAVVAIPLVARRLGPVAAVAPGGATAMDTTLPLIARAAGPQAAVLAFLSGAILSSLVPVLVPLFLSS